jgi:hypothetical protein
VASSKDLDEAISGNQPTSLATHLANEGYSSADIKKVLTSLSKYQERRPDQGPDDAIGRLEAGSSRR